MGTSLGALIYCEFLQLLVSLYNRLILIIVDYHLSYIMIMQLMQIWCRWLNCDNGWNTLGNKEKVERIPRSSSRPFNERLR